MKRLLNASSVTKILLVALLLFAGLSMTPSTEVQAANKTMYVKADSLNVRKGASTKSKVVTVAKKNAKVTVYTKKGSWSKVKVNKKNGWVASKYLANKKSKAKKTSNKKAAKKKATPVKKVRQTQKETIHFKTTKRNNNKLLKGKSKVVRNGKNGVRTKIIEKTYKGKKVTSTKVVSSKVTKKPVNKIIEVGTKVKPKPKAKPAKKQTKSPYASAAQAKKILGGSSYSKKDSWGPYLTAKVGNKHVTSVYFNVNTYITNKNASKSELIEILGPDLGLKEYKSAQSTVNRIQSEVRTVANSVYGPGTAKANSLYKEMIHAKSPFSKSFK